MSMVVKSPLATFRGVSAPAAGSKATISIAAQAAQSLPVGNSFAPWMVVTGIVCSIAAGGTGTSTNVQWNLIDGTTGGTNIQMNGVMAAVANGGGASVAMSNLTIPITSGTATLEFSAASPATVAQAVSIVGYHVNYGDQ